MVADSGYKVAELEVLQLSQAAVPDIEMIAVPDEQQVGRIAVFQRLAPQSPRVAVVGQVVLRVADMEIPPLFAVGTTCKEGKYPQEKLSRRCNPIPEKKKMEIFL